MMAINTAQRSLVRCSLVHCSIVHAVHCSAVQYSALQFILSRVMWNTAVLCSTVQCSAVFTVQYCHNCFGPPFLFVKGCDPVWFTTNLSVALPFPRPEHQVIHLV